LRRWFFGKSTQIFVIFLGDQKTGLFLMSWRIAGIAVSTVLADRKPVKKSGPYFWKQDRKKT